MDTRDKFSIERTIIAPDGFTRTEIVTFCDTIEEAEMMIGYFKGASKITTDLCDSKKSNVEYKIVKF